MKLKSIWIVCVLIFSVSLAQAQENWELRRNENGITIYSRRHNNLVELHLLCEFEGTPNQLINELFNIPNYTSWVYGNKRTGVIKKINDHDVIYFTETHLPWPIADRDLVVELTEIPATATNPLTLIAKSIEGILPQKPHFIRIPYSVATWHLTPAADNKLKVDYTFSINPGGNIPVWLANLTIATGPYKSFMKLGDMMKTANAK